MENGAISDKQIIASSEWNEKHSANMGRLHFNGGALGKASAWFSLTKDADQWLQIDLFSLGNKYTRITGVATQGRRNENYQQWVSKYKLQYSNDGVNFGYYKEQGQTADKVLWYKELHGCSKADSVIIYELNDCTVDKTPGYACKSRPSTLQL